MGAAVAKVVQPLWRKLSGERSDEARGRKKAKKAGKKEAAMEGRVSSPRVARCGVSGWRGGRRRELKRCYWCGVGGRRRFTGPARLQRPGCGRHHLLQHSFCRWCVCECMIVGVNVWWWYWGARTSALESDRR